MPTEDGTSEDNSSEQPTGPVKFRFVDSFWTDYTSLGGVVASTSAESITAQPLSPVIRQEVEPGQGEAVLAVVLRNLGFADATSIDRKSTRLNSSHANISYAVFCLKKKK